MQASGGRSVVNQHGQLLHHALFHQPDDCVTKQSFEDLRSQAGAWRTSGYDGAVFISTNSDPTTGS